MLGGGGMLGGAFGGGAFGGGAFGGLPLGLILGAGGCAGCLIIY